MNNKTYIIVTYNVCNQGGAQLYVLRRVKYLRQQGYEVHIIVSFDNGNFILKEDFSGFPIHYYPELKKQPLRYSIKKTNKILNRIISDLHISNSNIYIESHTLLLGLWAEKIAFRLSAKHLIYCLSELPPIRQARLYPGRKFFEAKYECGELYGCSSKSIEKIFDRTFSSNNYVNIAFDEKELAEESSPKLNIKVEEKEFVILTVTRLDKTYVEPLVHATCQLAKKYPTQSFKLIIAGGSKTKGREEYLFKTFSNDKVRISNLKIIFTGYINALGKDIFNFSNVFVGMGTASINAISQKCLTLNIDPLADNSCSGFFGMDTTNFAYPDDGKHYTIFEKLEQAYRLESSERELYVRKGRALFEQSYQLESCFGNLDKVFDTIAVVKSEPKFSLLLSRCFVLYNRMSMFVKGKR